MERGGVGPGTFLGSKQQDWLVTCTIYYQVGKTNSRAGKSTGTWLEDLASRYEYGGFACNEGGGAGRGRNGSWQASEWNKEGSEHERNEWLRRWWPAASDCKAGAGPQAQMQQSAPATCVDGGVRFTASPATLAGEWGARQSRAGCRESKRGRSASVRQRSRPSGIATHPHFSTEEWPDFLC